MTGLTLAHTSKYFGFGDEHDYVVLDGGCVIGRIMLHPQAAPECPWFWTITDPEAEPSAANRGYSATREGAMAHFKSRWFAA